MALSFYLRVPLCSAYLCALVGCAESTVRPESEGVRPETLTPKEWIALGRPSAPHQLLLNFVGMWDVAITTVDKPDARPEISQGVSRSSLILGSRFVRERFKGMVAGAPFEGLGFIGYDTGSRKFVSSWMDSLSTTIATSEGTYHGDSQIFEFVGEVYDPLLGAKRRTMTRIHVTSSDQYEVQTIDTTERGREFVPLQMVYRRRVSKPEELERSQR